MQYNHAYSTLRWQGPQLVQCEVHPKEQIPIILKEWRVRLRQPTQALFYQDS